MSKTGSGDHATTDRLSEYSHDSVDWIAKTAGKGEEKIRRKAADAEASLKDAGLRAKERSNETLQSICVFARDNPLIALGLAFSAGVLLSALRCGRKKVSAQPIETASRSVRRKGTAENGRHRPRPE